MWQARSEEKRKEDERKRFVANALFSYVWMSIYQIANYKILRIRVVPRIVLISIRQRDPTKREEIVGGARWSPDDERLGKSYARIII